MPPKLLRLTVLAALVFGLMAPAHALATSSPTAVDGSDTTNEDVSKLVTLTGTDPDGDTLTFAIDTSPTNGVVDTPVLVGCDGQTPSTCTATVNYSPFADANGPDSFTFTVDDGIDPVSAPGTITMTVNPVNDAPVLANTALSIPAVEDAPVPTGAVGALIGTLTGGITDVDSGDPKGIAIRSSNETNGTWYYTTDGGTNWILVGVVNQPNSLLLADDGSTRVYFKPNANFNGTSAGALTIRAWDQSTGTAGTKVSTASTGGSTAFSSATDTVDAVVSAVNDAPVLANTALSVGASKHDPAPSGAVGALVGTLTGGISDVDSGALQGIAVTASDETDGTWWFTTNGGGTWTAVGAVTGSSALLLADNGTTRLYFEPSASFSGTSAAALTIRAWDQTSGTAGTKVDASTNGGTTAFSTATDTVDAVVSAVNAAPVLANTALSITAVEDAVVPTGAVGALVGTLTGGITDADVGDPAGIAITGSVETNGTWYYSANSGTTWTLLGAVTASSALLLADDGASRLYFKPSANYNGTSTAALTIRAWDQSTGTAGTKVSTVSNGGTTAFSTATDTVDAVVTAVNDAPVLANTSLSVAAVEDAAVPTGAVGALIGTLTGGVTDVDAGDPKGIALRGIDETNGTWYWTINGGTNWFLVGAVSPSSSLLLADDGSTRLYFRPNANFNGTSAAALSIRAWDQSTGTAGNTVSTTSSGGSTAFSSATDSVDAIVSAVNDAPVLANTSLSVSAAEGDPLPSGAVGALVSTLSGGITDIDSGALQGIAITASDETNGTWYYTTNSGAAWTAVGVVSSASSLLLADNGSTRLYFRPSGIFNGTSTAALTIRAWDQTFGAAGTKVATTSNGGITAFSSATDTVDAIVSAVNDAPVLANTVLSVAAVEDAPVPVGAVGALVSTLTGGITDVDAGAVKGIALRGSDETNGTWYYTTNGGTTWTLVGAVSPAASLLLADNASTRLYFKPTANYNGTSVGALSIRAWDQTSGANGTIASTAASGGATAFSSATDSVDAIVSAVNDPPTFTKGANQTVAEDSGARSVVGWATSMSPGPANESGQTLTFAVIANTNATLFLVPPAVNATTGTLTYTPAANANGTATITLRLDDNAGGQSATQTFSITVTPVNDGPPNAANDVGITVPQNATAKAINVLANDSTGVDTNETLTITARTQGVHGTVTITGGGTGLTYTPVATYRGSDSFTYTISDGTFTDSATVLLTVVQAGTVTRISGADRYAVSAAISKASFPVGVPVVYIATGLGFADALSGAPVAGIKHGPILLVPGTSIPATVAAELTRLKPLKIVILGGTGVVSSGVATSLKTYTTGTVTRLSGADRYATSAAVSAANFAANVPIVYIATGLGFPDALSGAPVAAIKGGPILLVPGTTIPTVIQTELTRLKPGKIVILGGTGVVSSGVALALDAYTTGTVTRLSGADRYATSAAISTANFAPHVATVYIATGLDFPDALSGSPVAAGHLGPILLVPATGLPASIVAELIRLKPANIVIFGSTTSVPDATKTLLGFYTTGP